MTPKAYHVRMLMNYLIHLKTAQSDSNEHQPGIVNAFCVYQFHQCAQMPFVAVSCQMPEYFRRVAVKYVLKHADLLPVLHVDDLAKTCAWFRKNVCWYEVCVFRMGELNGTHMILLQTKTVD